MATKKAKPEVWMCIGEYFTASHTWKTGFCGVRGPRGFWLEKMQAGGLGVGATISESEAKALMECSSEDFKSRMTQITGKRFENVKA